MDFPFQLQVSESECMIYPRNDKFHAIHKSSSQPFPVFRLKTPKLLQCNREKIEYGENALEHDKFAEQDNIDSSIGILFIAVSILTSI